MPDETAPDMSARERPTDWLRTEAEVRTIGAEWAMRKVLDEVQRRGLVPMVLIAHSEEENRPYVLPCGPAKQEAIMAYLRSVLAAPSEEVRK